MDVRALLSQVRVPTLVLHARHDEAVPFSAGKMLATEIPNAEFVQLDSRNHILLADEPAWTRFKEAVLAFVGHSVRATTENPLFATLSEREREILAALVAGRSNSGDRGSAFHQRQDGPQFLTRIFEKLGVRTRMQAAVLARDHGFTPAAET